MLRLGILGLIIIVALLALTNPSHETHKKVVYASAAAKVTKSELLSKIAVDVLESVDVIPLAYHNYFLFSTTTLDDERTSVGICSHVWKLDRSAAAAKQ